MNTNKQYTALNHIYTLTKVFFLICWGLLSDTISNITLSLEITEMYCVVASYLTNRMSESNVQFRAGSSIRESGGTVHPAAQLIADPRFDYYTNDFDLAVARVSDYVFANLHFDNTILIWVKTRLIRGGIWFTN
jgi:hypothetical protein